jgi:hypothetical protein
VLTACFDISFFIFQDTSVLTKMQTWDQAVASRVQGALGMDAARVLAYKIIGDAGGIGLSQDGTGFAQVSLVSNSDQSCVLILSGILTVQFAPDSSRLQSMRWTTTEDGLLAAVKPRRTQEDSSVRLGQQMVYPSMVSLENHKNSETYD